MFVSVAQKLLDPDNINVFIYLACRAMYLKIVSKLQQ